MDRKQNTETMTDSYIRDELRNLAHDIGDETDWNAPITADELLDRFFDHHRKMDTRITFVNARTILERARRIADELAG